MTARTRLSPRLAEIVAALPLEPDSRVLEVGCGTGAAARAVAARLVSGHILAIDRSAAAIARARAAAADEIASGRMSVRQVAVEDFLLRPDEEPFDIVFAVRVGALDGRHPKAGELALRRIATVTTARARLFVDGGSPLRELPIASDAGSALNTLLRWEQHGGIWRTRSLGDAEAVVELCTCAGERVEQIRFTDPAVLRHVAEHPASDAP